MSFAAFSAPAVSSEASREAVASSESSLDSAVALCAAGLLLCLQHVLASLVGSQSPLFVSLT